MKLRPCPFCGNDNISLQADYRIFYYDCCECGTMGPSCMGWEAAEREWNSRAYDEYVTALEAILATLDLDKDTRDSINRAIAGLKGE